MTNFLKTKDDTLTPVASPADYIGQGKNFLEACRQLRQTQRRGEEGIQSRQRIDSLKELLSLLHRPDEDAPSAITEMWIPSKLFLREERFFNYLLWQAFTSDRDRRTQFCPSIGEELLLEALQAGENEFEQKHHIFNLLVSSGFPKRQACILAKYLNLP